MPIKYDYSPQGPLAGYLLYRDIQREDKAFATEQAQKQLDIQEQTAKFREWMADASLRAAERKLKQKSDEIDLQHIEQIKSVERAANTVALKTAEIKLNEGQRDWLGNELALVKDQATWTRLKRRATSMGVDLEGLKNKEWNDVQDVIIPVRDHIIENVPFEREKRLAQVKGLYAARGREAKPTKIIIPPITKSERQAANALLSEIELPDQSGKMQTLGDELSDSDRRVYSDYLLNEAKALQRDLGAQGQAVGLETLMLQIHEDSKSAIKAVDPFGPNFGQNNFVLDIKALQQKSTAHLYGKPENEGEITPLPDGLTEAQVQKAMTKYGVSRAAVIKQFNDANARNKGTVYGTTQ